jgi:hypothetical protein
VSRAVAPLAPHTTRATLRRSSTTFSLISLRCGFAHVILLTVGIAQAEDDYAKEKQSATQKKEALAISEKSLEDAARVGLKPADQKKLEEIRAEQQAGVADASQR